MESTGITPVMDMNRGYGFDGFGGGSGIWLFAILALMWGGNGFFGGRTNVGTEAIQADINRGFDSQNLQAQTRDILTAVNAGTAQSVATSNQVYHDLVASFNDKYSELQRDVAGLAVGQANLLAKENECCCSVLRGIDGINYTSALNTAAIKEAIVAEGQKTRDLITGNKIEELQSKVDKLELAQAVSGVVRYPSSMTYAYNANPFCSCGCNGNI